MKKILKPILLSILMMYAIDSVANQIEIKKLPTCEGTANCVSSQSTSKLHYIPPFKVSGDPGYAWQQFRKAIQNQDRMLITHETDSSLHAEATSLVLHFVDDIDAFIDLKAGLIHIRSASRVGHSDFGINRKRLEELRASLKKLHVLV